MTFEGGIGVSVGKISEHRAFGLFLRSVRKHGVEVFLVRCLEDGVGLYALQWRLGKVA